METTVYISSPMDFKSRIREWWKNLRLKAALQHFGLLITLMGYTLVGGLVFRRFEGPAETSRIEYYNRTLLETRTNLINVVVNNSDLKNLNVLLSYHLDNYEKMLQKAFNDGITIYPQEQLVKWTTLKAVFFSSTVLTTIEQPKYMLLCTLYILVGLALTSTIIELVRRQYAQSWRQLRALRGPLAENFRKFADNANGLDVLAFQQDLMKVLTVVSMPRKSMSSGTKKDKKLKQKEWEDAIQAVIRDITEGNAAGDQKPPMVQIVIYESSV